MSAASEGYPADTVWVRFEWDLADLGTPPPRPTEYEFGIGTEADIEEITRVVIDAYASDPVWAPMMDGIRRRMAGRVHETLGKEGSDYLIVRRDGRIAGVSGVAREHWTDQNLLTGLCVAPDDQRKGLGRVLLFDSLVKLRDLGLARARVYTEQGSLADLKLYPMYGSTRTPGVEYPALMRDPGAPRGEAPASPATGRVCAYNPSAAPPVGNYSQAVSSQHALLHVSGQVGVDAAGNTVGAEAAEQVAAAFDNLTAVLSEASLRLQDLVFLRVFVVTDEAALEYRKQRDARLGSPYPASTLVYVPRLGRPEWLIELEAVAEVPAATREVVRG